MNTQPLIDAVEDRVEEPKAQMTSMRESMVNNLIKVDAPHPIHTFMEEHQIILQTLRDLDVLLTRMEDYHAYEDMGADLEKLKEVSHLLRCAEKHHAREEECLFPMMEKCGITAPTAVMRAEHVEFRVRKKDLYETAHEHQHLDFDTFKKKVTDLGGYIVRELDNHIFKEDFILYQMALQTLSEKEWKEIKRGADEIGYCCFTPEDILS